jgi:hypothetical protein
MVLKEKTMRDGETGKIGKVNLFFSSHIPIPYGCIIMPVLVLLALGALAVSALALSAAILK